MGTEACYTVLHRGWRWSQIFNFHFRFFEIHVVWFLFLTFQLSQQWPKKDNQREFRKSESGSGCEKLHNRPLFIKSDLANCDPVGSELLQTVPTIQHQQVSSITWHRQGGRQEGKRSLARMTWQQCVHSSLFQLPPTPSWSYRATSHRRSVDDCVCVVPPNQLWILRWSWSMGTTKSKDKEKEEILTGDWKLLLWLTISKADDGPSISTSSEFLFLLLWWFSFTFNRSVN